MVSTIGETAPAVAAPIETVAVSTLSLPLWAIDQVITEPGIVGASRNNAAFSLALISACCSPSKDDTPRKPDCQISITPSEASVPQFGTVDCGTNSNGSVVRGNSKPLFKPLKKPSITSSMPSLSVSTANAGVATDNARATHPASTVR